MRPQHYVKNLLVFLPLFFGGKLMNTEYLRNTLIAFTAFSLASSAVYCFNDICDAEGDRLDEKRKNRPIASGEISAKNAYILYALLIVMSLAVIFRSGLRAIVAVIGYILINVAYSLKIRDVKFADVAILTAGFLLRVFVGSAVTGIKISMFMLFTVTFFSMYMSFGKRYGEMKYSHSRKVLERYSEKTLRKAMNICAFAGLLTYFLWGISLGKALVTFPLVLIIIIRYDRNIEKSGLSSPVEILFTDKLLLVLAMVYSLSAFLVVYF